MQNHEKRILLALAAPLLLSPPARAQLGPKQTISTIVKAASFVRTADVDGDGDIDLLTASSTNGWIAWYENQGSGQFMHHEIAKFMHGNRTIHAADLDGDQDVDVVTATYSKDLKVVWFRNLGGGTFDGGHVLSTDVDHPTGVDSADLDGDGDPDVLSSSYFDGKVAWYENMGAGGFGPQRVITTQAYGATSVLAADLDGDGDVDVLSGPYSPVSQGVAWYENLGVGSFGPVNSFWRSTICTTPPLLVP